MYDSQDLVQKINDTYASMSKGQKQISEYVLKNYDKAAFMTALRLAEKVGVSESTVVRYAMALGYKGYPELQRSLQEMVRNKLTSIQRMEMTSDMDRSAVLRSVLKADMNNIRATIEEINTDIFDDIVDTVLWARRLYITGLRSSAPLAQFLGYYLNFMLDDVQVVTSGVNDTLEQVFHISERDAILGISFPRYSRRTVECVRYAKGRGARVIAITDSPLSPLAQYADHLLIARSDIASFVDSLVAPMSVINALLVSVSLRRREELARHFEELEAIWDTYNVYLEKGKD